METVMLKHLANLTIFRSMTHSAIWHFRPAFKCWSCASVVAAFLVAPAFLSPAYAQQNGLFEFRFEFKKDSAVSTKPPKGTAKKKSGQKTVSKKGPPPASTPGIEWSFGWNSTGAANNNGNSNNNGDSNNSGNNSNNNKPRPKHSKSLTIKKGPLNFILTDGINPGQ